MRDFLCQILAHYMVYLGSQLKLHIAGYAEKFILKAAPTRWHKEGSFRWRTRLDDPGVAGDFPETEVDSSLDIACLRRDSPHPIFQPPMWGADEDSQSLQILGFDSIPLDNCSEIAFGILDLPADPRVSSDISGASAILGRPLQLPQPQFHVSLPYSDDPSTASNTQSSSDCLLAGTGCAYTVIDPPLEQFSKPRIRPSTGETELPKESDEEPYGNRHKKGKITEQLRYRYSWWRCCVCDRELNEKLWLELCPDCRHMRCSYCPAVSRRSASGYLLC
jgi:hypothetical protein